VTAYENAPDNLQNDITFAKAGYLAVTFDYRGWGKSDSRLILAGGKPEPKDGKLIAEVRDVREVVDPIDQTTDLLNAINWVQGEPLCDGNRIGLWGSSFAGAPVLEKLMGYAPIEDIGRCEHVAKLFIIAENEELFDNTDHAILAHQRATGIKKLITMIGIKHYGIYSGNGKEAQQLALDWFDDYLTK
jgi:hypothetical protein